MKLCVLSLALVVGCAREPASPTFVIDDPHKPNERLAVFVAEQTLRQHRISARDYETLFRRMLDAAGEAVADVTAQSIAAEATNAQQGEERRRVSNDEWIAMLKNAGLTPASFDELLGSTRAEAWAMKPDGTHTVVHAFPTMRANPEPSDSAGSR